MSFYISDFKSFDEINFWRPKSELIAENNLLLHSYSLIMSFGLLVHYSFVFLEMFLTSATVFIAK